MTSPEDQPQTDRPLAGTQCPSCQAVCVYQPPEDAMAMGITTVDIACHACGHVFETALPDASPDVTDHDQSQHPSQETGQALDAAVDELVAEKKKLKPKKQKASGGMAKRLGVMLGVTFLGSAAIIGTGIYLNPPVERQSLEEQFKAKKTKPASPKTPKKQPAEKQPADKQEVKKEAPKPEAPQTAPPAPEPKQEIKVPITPAVFASHHSGFTIADNDLGQVMTVNFSITNDGGSPGLPNAVTVYLINAQGQIAMSWPVDTGSRAFDKNETRSFNIDVLEPPENITSVEININ